MFRWIFNSSNSPRVQPAEEGDCEQEAQASGAAAILDRVAAAVVRRGLVTPAVYFIELNWPLSFLAGQAVHVLFPLLAPLLGVELARQLAGLLEDPANVDRLLDRIERPEQREAV